MQAYVSFGHTLSNISTCEVRCIVKMQSDENLLTWCFKSRFDLIEHLLDDGGNILQGYDRTSHAVPRKLADKYDKVAFTSQSCYSNGSKGIPA